MASGACRVNQNNDQPMKYLLLILTGSIALTITGCVYGHRDRPDDHDHPAFEHRDAPSGVDHGEHPGDMDHDENR